MRRCFAALLLAGFLFAGSASAQQPGQPAQERPYPVFQNIAALITAIAVLTIICYPSRKGADPAQRED